MPIVERHLGPQLTIATLSQPNIEIQMLFKSLRVDYIGVSTPPRPKLVIQKMESMPQLLLLFVRIHVLWQSIFVPHKRYGSFASVS